MNDDDKKDDQLFVYKLFGISTPRLLKSRSNLRQRIGPTATISDAQILKAQYHAEKPAVDFTPYILDYISQLESIVEMLRADDYGREDHYDRTTIPIVQIKGQAAMFGKPFVSSVSEKILFFMEQYKRLDNDVLDILTAYCAVIKTVCDADSTASQDNLMEEIESALNRYKLKFDRKTGK